MLGRTYKNKADGELWKVVADDQNGRWVLTPVDFGPNVAFTPAEIRSQFVKAQDVEETPPLPSYDDITAGWGRLSAEQRFAVIAEAAADGLIQPGDTLTRPGFDGQPVASSAPLTKDDVSRLRAAARRLRGTNEPSPEKVFADGQRSEIDAAAEKITGSAELLAKYETGALETSPAVAQVVDRFIARRNREHDRQAYPNAHVFDRSGPSV